MTNLEVLKRARDVLVSKGWTQRAYARDKNGNSCAPNHEGAATFCASGALDVVSKDHTVFYAARDALRTGGISIDFTVAEWNDAPDRTKAEVLAVFDNAIAKLEQP